MKTFRIILVSLLFITGFLAISASGNSQGIRPDRKERKEAKKAQMEANFYILDSLLNSKRYVLEADFLQSRGGVMVSVNSTINFIKVDVDHGVLQTGSDVRLGSNGVGGVTAEGSLQGYKITKNLKNLSHSIHFNLLTNIGSYDIILTVSANNNAAATITGTGSGALTWKGRLKTLENTRVFKGQNTI